MTRNLKALGLALVAAFALSAVVASAASADKLVTEGGANAVITGKSTAGAVFGTKGSSVTVECSDSTFTGTATNNATTLNIVPTYDECTSEVHLDRCEFIIHSNTTSHAKTVSGTETDAPVDLNCATGGEITITAPLCPITITAQTGLHGVTFTNLTENGKNVVELKLTVDNIAYHAPANFWCEFGGVETTTGTDGYLTGEVMATGYQDTGSSSGTYNYDYSHGATQVGISVENT